MDITHAVLFYRCSKDVASPTAVGIKSEIKTEYKRPCCVRGVIFDLRFVKPTFLIRDADLSLPIAGLPALPDVGSSETELRRPTCYLVQVITEPQRHGGVFLSLFVPASRRGIGR